jgi:hypothetical protein
MKDLSQLKPLREFKIADKVYNTDEMFRNVNIFSTEALTQAQSHDLDQPQNWQIYFDQLLLFCYSQWKQLQINSDNLYISQMYNDNINNTQNQLPNFLNKEANYKIHLGLLEQFKKQQQEIFSKLAKYELSIFKVNSNNDFIFDTVKKCIEQAAQLHPTSEELNMLQDFMDLIKHHSYQWRELQSHNYKEWLELTISNDINLSEILNINNTLTQLNILKEKNVLARERLTRLESYNKIKIQELDNYNLQAFDKLKNYKYFSIFNDWIIEFQEENKSTLESLKSHYYTELRSFNTLLQHTQTQLETLGNYSHINWQNFYNILNNPSITIDQKKTYLLTIYEYSCIKGNNVINIPTIFYQVNAAITLHKNLLSQSYKETEMHEFIISLKSLTSPTMLPYIDVYSQPQSNIHALSATKLSILISYNYEQSQKLIMNLNYSYPINEYISNINNLYLLEPTKLTGNLQNFHNEHLKILNTCIEQEKSMLYYQEECEVTTSLVEKFNKKTMDDLKQYNQQELDKIRQNMHNAPHDISDKNLIFFIEFTKSVESIFNHWKELKHYNYESWAQLLVYNNVQLQDILMSPLSDQNRKITNFQYKTIDQILSIKKHNENTWETIKIITEEISTKLKEYKAHNAEESEQYDKWLQKVQKDNQTMWYHIENHHSFERNEWNILMADNISQILQLQNASGNQFQQWKSLILPQNQNDNQQQRLYNLREMFKFWHQNNPNANLTIFYQIFAANQCYAVIKENHQVMDIVSSRILSSANTVHHEGTIDRTTQQHAPQKGTKPFEDAATKRAKRSKKPQYAPQAYSQPSQQPQYAPPAYSQSSQQTGTVIAQPSVNAATVFAQSSRAFNANNNIISGGHQYQHQAHGYQHQHQAHGYQHQQQAYGQQYHQQAGYNRQQNSGFNLSAAPFIPGVGGMGNPQGSTFTRAESDHVPPLPQAAGMDNPQNNPFLSRAPTQPGNAPHQQPASNTNPTREADTLLSSRYINAVIGNRQNNQNNPSR